MLASAAQKLTGWRQPQCLLSTSALILCVGPWLTHFKLSLATCAAPGMINTQQMDSLFSHILKIIYSFLQMQSLPSCPCCPAILERQTASTVNYLSVWHGTSASFGRSPPSSTTGDPVMLSLCDINISSSKSYTQMAIWLSASSESQFSNF